jgi:hypothetical protein
MPAKEVNIALGQLALRGRLRRPGEASGLLDFFVTFCVKAKSKEESSTQAETPLLRVAWKPNL